MRNFITASALLFSVTAYSQGSFDKTEELYGVSLKSGKADSTRSYIGSIKKTFPYPISIVKNGVTNFTEKCNNSYKSKRKFTDEKLDCKYHNEHMVESFLVTDLKPSEKFKDANEVYLIGRQIYNRGSYGHYELVQIREGQNEKKQKTVTLMLRMLEDEEAQQLTEIKINKESAFTKSSGTFVLTETSADETHLSYEFNAQTEHWLLNKEISVPQVFASISKTITDLMKTVEVESSMHKRNVASKQ